jgi:K+-transporting ATPase A subunit
MTFIGWTQIILFCAIIVAITPLLGGYMARVFNGEHTSLSPVLRPVEAAIYRAGGVDARREQSWVIYAVGMLFFHVGGFLILYAIQRFQRRAAATTDCRRHRHLMPTPDAIAARARRLLDQAGFLPAP